MEQCNHGTVFNEAQTQLYLPVIRIPPKHGIQVLNSTSELRVTRTDRKVNTTLTRLQLIKSLLAVFSEMPLNHVYNFIPFQNSATVWLQQMSQVPTIWFQTF